MLFALNSIIMGLIGILVLGVAIYVVVLIVKALKKYLKSSTVRQEKNEVKKSLGEAKEEITDSN